jgi:hypothetical protein
MATSSLSRLQATKLLQFPNIMYQTEQLPLALHLLLAPQAEPPQALVAGQIAKHRFYHTHAFAVDRLAFFTVDSVLHPVRVRCGAVLPCLHHKGYLPTISCAVIRRFGVDHAFGFERTVPALQQSAFKVGNRIAIAICFGATVAGSLRGSDR